ncbi:sensor histidine kinase [Tellurirhabdus rosea]|uniref:sensor histidine kinase n=1 Tax=Tellurirhabdus rosea TaxID=2674997 RepID=UPI00225B35F0|nr:sensor histidine kinase [Tellurirhabdus rosea]
MNLVERVRPCFFSKSEWIYHLLMMPVLAPLGNYFFIGPRYATDRTTFVSATLLVIGLYWLSVVLMTLAVRCVFRRFPAANRPLRRLLVMGGVVGGATLVLGIFDTWLYSLVPATGVRFSWDIVRAIWRLGLIFDVFLCGALLLFDAYHRQYPQQKAALPSGQAAPGFSPFEWGFHSLAVFVFTPVANLLLVGQRYLEDLLIFLLGSSVVVLAYIPNVLLVTALIRYSIRKYPGLSQTRQRLRLMIGWSLPVVYTLNILTLWLFSKVPLLAIPFSWESYWTVLGVGVLFVVVFSLGNSYFYALQRWQTEEIENEALKKNTLRRRFEDLKGRVNPHFLFNSLNSLSSLIAEDRPCAERFVDELAKVYRYLLHLNTSEPLTTLDRELAFINSYAFLLKTRYGNGISLHMELETDPAHCYLPPLTLQTLVDNAMKHNVILTQNPLHIHIRATESGQILVWNTIRKRMVRVDTRPAGLSGLAAKYRLVGDQDIQVRDDGARFLVELPALPQELTAEKA